MTAIVENEVEKSKEHEMDIYRVEGLGVCTPHTPCRLTGTPLEGETYVCI